MENEAHKPSPELKIERITINEGLTTIIYASAVNLILAESIKNVSLLSFASIGMIIFIFADWSTRISVPLRFPPPDQIQRKRTIIQLSKTGCEIIGMVFLIIAFVTYLSQHNPNYGFKSLFFMRKSVAGYLLFSFLWNRLALVIMQELKYRELLCGGLFGNVFDLEGADKYTKHFKKLFTHQEDKLKNAQTKRDRLVQFWSYHAAIFKESCGRTIAQLLAHHIAWVNFIIFLYIFTFADVERPYQMIYFNGIFWHILVTLSLFILPTLFFFTYLVYKNYKDCDEERGKLFKFLGGLSSLLLLLLFYSIFNIDNLIYVMFIEQVVVSVIIQFSSPKAPLRSLNIEI